MHPVHLPALVRLVREGHLAELALCDINILRPSEGDIVGPVPRAAWAALCAAVAASTSLRRLTAVRLLGATRWAVEALCKAVTGHATLQEVCVSGCTNFYGWPPYESEIPPEKARANKRADGRALARIIGANAPALRSLRFEHCFLGEPGLAAVLPALAVNTHLQLLGVWCAGRAAPLDYPLPPAPLSERFIDDVMRPALARSLSLRRLLLVPHHEALPDAKDALSAGPSSEETRRVRARLAALAEEVASRPHTDAAASRAWARCARRWAPLMAAAATAQERM
jgi:hypothetical protein